MPNPVRAFINFNKKYYFALLKFFPNSKFNIYSYYREQVKANLRADIASGARVPIDDSSADLVTSSSVLRY